MKALRGFKSLSLRYALKSFLKEKTLSKPDILKKIIETSFCDSIIQKSSRPIKNISTDSRKIQPDEIFLALEGERFDGHQFIGDVLQKGASGLIIRKNKIPLHYPKDVWILAVEDTLKTYQDIASFYLRFLPVQKIAVTGSSGKTTVKEFLRALLSLRYSVFANTGNLNNQIGVPLSILQINREEVVVLEMGTGKPGDIARLSSLVLPDIAVVTSVGEAHLEFFQTVENIAREKASILLPNAIGYCPKDIAYPSYFKDFHFIDPTSIFQEIKQLETGWRLKLDNQTLVLPFLGTHNLSNFALAVAVAQKMGISASSMQEAIDRIVLPSGRMEKKVWKEITLYLDCYNANPLSLKKSLETFFSLPKPAKKIAVLGDMLELGEESQRLHSEIGDFLNSYKLDFVCFYGKNMFFAYEKYKGPKQYFENHSEIAHFLFSSLKPSDMVLFKGSRGMKLENIVELLEKIS